MAMPRPLDDLGPDFEARWRRAPQQYRRELIAELRDLYFMLEEEDAVLLTQVGLAPSATGPASAQKSGAQQGSLFNENPEPPPRKENPFLPRSVLARLQQSQHQASAGLRDLMHSAQGASPSQPAPAATPLTPAQSTLERELRLRLGPVVEDLLEAQMELLKSELRVRLRAEMDRLIAEHVRKQGQ